MSAQTAALWAAAIAGLTPDRPMSVSQWADANIVLDSSTSAEPGRWRTDRTPYLREIMDRLGLDDPVQEISVMAGSQLGKSSAGNAWLAWIMAQSPGPTMMVQPTTETAEKYSKQRIAPMIGNCAALSRVVAPTRSRDSGNTVLLKEFPGGFLTIVGSNAPSGLASTPIRRLFLDEVDRFPQDAGGEGDPVALARQRTATFSFGRKVLLTSTPTVEGFSRIEKAYLDSDRRRYWVPCPHCHEMQALQWRGTPESPGGVVWPTGRPDLAGYACAHCGVVLVNSDKNWMLSRGEWRADKPGARTAGYHLSSLYSPHGWISWADMAIEFCEAGADPDRLKVFVNTKLAETFKPGSASEVRATGLAARAEVYDAEVPEGVKIITCGVDVQDDRLELEIVGWGASEESWSLAWHVLPGDPAQPQVWGDLDALLRRDLQRRDGTRCKIQATAIDSGGHRTQPVYTFCRGKEARRVWAIKGAGSSTAGKRALWPRTPTRRKSGAQVYVLGVDSGKESVFARLKVRDPGPGYLHFPATHPAAYFEMLTAERVEVSRYRGREIRKWVCPPGRRNEAFDCRIYAYAALHGLYALGHKLPQISVIALPVAPPAPAAHTDPAPAPAPRPPTVAPVQAVTPKRVKKPSVYERM